MKFKFAELANGSIKRRPGHLKWGDVVLKRGASAVDAFALKLAPQGSTFTLESQTGGDPATIAELRAAINGKESFDLLLTGGSNVASLKTEWISSITVKQTATRAGFGIEIELRKG